MEGNSYYSQCSLLIRHFIVIISFVSLNTQLRKVRLMEVVWLVQPHPSMPPQPCCFCHTYLRERSLPERFFFFLPSKSFDAIHLSTLSSPRAIIKEQLGQTPSRLPGTFGKRGNGGKFRGWERVQDPGAFSSAIILQAKKDDLALLTVNCTFSHMWTLLCPARFSYIFL